ncbi:MAG: hypothetical protein MZV70_45070 [Desulfobacterales bacterium]|nr:hypothetical protein [Desulfobacterales bacterium]
MLKPVHLSFALDADLVLQDTAPGARLELSFRKGAGIVSECGCFFHHFV